LSKFKVGDTVVANKRASDVYATTIEGWVGVVYRVDDEGYFHAKPTGKLKDAGYFLKDEYFDLVRTPTDEERFWKEASILNEKCI